jgi:hypothetical protein
MFLFYQKYKAINTLSFFEVIPWLVHTAVPSVHKAPDATCKESFPLCAKPRTHRVRNVFIACKSVSVCDNCFHSMLGCAYEYFHFYNVAATFHRLL